MQKVSKIVLYVLVAISVTLGFFFYLGGNVTEDTGLLTDEEPIYTAIYLTWTYALFFAAVALTLLFSLFYIVTHPKALKSALITLGVGAVLVFVAYLLASDAPVPGRGVDATVQELKWVGTGIYVAYILGAVAIVGIVVSEIYRALT